MSLRITIDIFSGRPNPVIEIDGREEKAILERVAPVRKLKRDELVPAPESVLGYRGLIIEPVDPRARGLPKRFRFVHGDLFGPRLAHRAADEFFEDFICGSSGPMRKLKLGREFPEFLRREISRYRKVRYDFLPKPIRFPPRRSCRCAPLYEPQWWNDAGQKQFNNNCYNYGTDYRSDTFAQPGLAAGAMYSALTCAAVRPAAINDALINAPTANNKCPSEGHLVALVIAPGWDFHWYRKGRNGYWSHKPGGTPVTNVDNSNVSIPDPRSANRGPYTDFCTFMIVMHGHIKVR